MSMSDLWRENKSKDPGLDLVSILGAARVMATSLAPDVDVTFAGVKGAKTDRKTIMLSAKVLGDEHPVDGDKVDCLLGLTVHELGHVIYSPDKRQLLKAIDKKLRKIRPKAVVDIMEILEDVYVDHLMSALPGYRDYLRVAIQYAVSNISADKITGILDRPVTQQEMLNAFAAIALADLPIPANILPQNMAVLSKLVAIAQKLCTKSISREKAILESWKIISGLPERISPEDKLSSKMQEDSPGRQEPDQSQDDDMGDESGSEDTTEDAIDGDQQQDDVEEKEEPLEETDRDSRDNALEKGDKQPDKDDAESGLGSSDDDSPESNDISISQIINADIDRKVELEPDVADDVAQALIDKREDLTQMLSLLAKKAADTVIAYTPAEDGWSVAKARRETQQVEEKLRRILQDLRLRRTEDYRGLYSGKISARRLYRTGYGDKRVFQRRERPGEINMAVCLLMDLSGSVRGERSLIEQVVVAICDAFQKEKLEFIALGYSGHEGIAYIPRLYDRECGKIHLGLESLKMWGGTPSYEGLAAGIAQLLRFGGNKPKVLFHCTDGMPDYPGRWAIPDLLKDARQKGILDVHISLGEPSSSFKEIYGEPAVIENISELPGIIEKQLRNKLGI